MRGAAYIAPSLLTLPAWTDKQTFAPCPSDVPCLVCMSCPQHCAPWEQHSLYIWGVECSHSQLCPCQVRAAASCHWHCSSHSGGTRDSLALPVLLFALFFLQYCHSFTSVKDSLVRPSALKSICSKFLIKHIKFTLSLDSLKKLLIFQISC